MTRITQFNPELAARLASTHALLLASHLVVHDSVECVILHGSRGLADHPRQDSDIDLSLVVNGEDLARSPNKDELLRTVLKITQDHWQGSIECDLATVFDKKDCGLKCLARQSFDRTLCPDTIDCMGLFKITHGFNGFVAGRQIDCEKMYPLIVIWKRTGMGPTIADTLRFCRGGENAGAA